MSKQSSVKWLVNILLHKVELTEIEKMYIKQALQMEREQIQKAFVSGDNHGHYIEPSQYYNQTYGGQDE